MHASLAKGDERPWVELLRENIYLKNQVDVFALLNSSFSYAVRRHFTTGV